MGGRLPNTLEDVIPEGRRNQTLFGLARGLVQKGHQAEAVNQRLQKLNAERCQPPLCATEVDVIATNAAKQGARGYLALPYALLDAPEYRALSPAAHDVIVTAFRRYNGSNNGNIALQASDFSDIPGLRDKDTVKRARDAAVEAGILLQVGGGRMTQKGRAPFLYAIAPKWLSAIPARGQFPALRKGGNSTPYMNNRAVQDERALGGEPHERPKDETA